MFLSTEIEETAAEPAALTSVRRAHGHLDPLLCVGPVDRFHQNVHLAQPEITALLDERVDLESAVLPELVDVACESDPQEIADGTGQKPFWR